MNLIAAMNRGPRSSACGTVPVSTPAAIASRANSCTNAVDANVRLYRDEVGGLQCAAPQDWMCEPQIVAKTGLSVREHQQRTVENLLDRLVASGADRETLIVGVGGGVASDLFGFTASLFMRGVPYIQVAYAFSGFPVTQEVFDAVLTVLNRLAGTNYTQADLADVRIAPGEGEDV